MQRDQKVGLALGVLLIGAVAAFFFRNDPDPSARVPELESAQEVNREIAEKRLTPYLTEAEAEEPPRGTRARPATERRKAHDSRTGERKLPRWAELQSEPDDPFAEASPEGRDVPAPAPDPIQFETVTTEPVVGPIPAHNQAWKPDAVTTLEAVAPMPAELTHEVQRGETLSSIAGKYLGSQARFHEIFAANTDRLRDANDLQVGMKLRIPDGKSSPVAIKPAAPVKRVKPLAETAADAPQPVEAEVQAVSTTRESSVEPTDELIAAEPGDLAEEQPSAETPPVEPPKVKFSPAKRRPGRAAVSP